MINNKLLLFIKLIVFVLALVICDTLFGVMCRKLSQLALSKSPNCMITEYTMDVVKDDVIIIGASEAHSGFVPSILSDELGMSVYNCALDGKRFYYQNAMIDGVLRRYSPKLILWSVSPSFLSKPSKADDADSRLNPYYSKNSFCKRIILRKSKYENIKMFSSLYRYNSSLLFYIMAIVKDYDYERGYAPLFGTDETMRMKSSKGNVDLDLESAKVFRETLSKCVDRGVTPILIFTPRFFNDSYRNLPQYRELKLICRELNVPLIDNLYHSDKVMNKRYFKDNAHLNDEGARCFSRLLADEVDSIITSRCI